MFDGLLDFSVRALPHTYEGVQAEQGEAVNIHVDQRAWSLVRGDSRWQIFRGSAPHPATTIRLGGDAAWRLLYNALSAEAARAAAAIEGEPALAQPLLWARSVMV